MTIMTGPPVQGLHLSPRGVAIIQLTKIAMSHVAVSKNNNDRKRLKLVEQFQLVQNQLTVAAIRWMSLHSWESMG